MAFNLQIYNRFSSLLPDGDIEIGDLSKPASISVTGSTFRKEVSIAAAGNASMYANELSGFEVMGIRADLTTRILVEDDAGGSFSLTVRGSGTANEYGPVMMFHSDDTDDATTLIDAITAYNDYAGATCKVLLIAVK